MSRIQCGDAISELSLPAIDGSHFTIGQVAGKRFLLSFFRFASCPFCNLRVHQLVTKFPEFSSQFTVVGIFDASIDELQRTAERHHSPFPILADRDNRYYQRFGVERSWLGVAKGMLLRFPQLLYSVFVKGHIPLKIGGHMATMPLNLLVDEQGIVQYAHYGQDEGDHLPMAVVEAFANRGEVPDVAVKLPTE